MKDEPPIVDIKQGRERIALQRRKREIGQLAPYQYGEEHRQHARKQPPEAANPKGGKIERARLLPPGDENVRD
ncbi:hypothetical protein D3C73_1544860 [compost metagenome]